jgi:hypothetical protein
LDEAALTDGLPDTTFLSKKDELALIANAGELRANGAFDLESLP